MQRSYQCFIGTVQRWHANSCGKWGHNTNYCACTALLIIWPSWYVFLRIHVNIKLFPAVSNVLFSICSLKSAMTWQYSCVYVSIDSCVVAGASVRRPWTFIRCGRVEWDIKGLGKKMLNFNCFINRITNDS